MDSPRSQVPEDATSPPLDAIKAQMEHILASKSFAMSKDLSSLFRFLMEETLNGSKTNDYSIGINVFGKKEDFDPRIDSTVRVQARKLRNKLQEYYASTGMNDVVEIQLPPRQHMLEIRWKESKKLCHDPAVGDRIPVIGFHCFHNLSSDLENQLFCDNLAEELRNVMSDVHAARLLTVHPSDQRTTISAAGYAESKLDSLLEGRVRKAAGRVRVSVQLMSSLDGSILWSEMYERCIADPLGVQKEIAHAIAQTLQTYAETRDSSRRQPTKIYPLPPSP
jgi:TolB-like protein